MSIFYYNFQAEDGKTWPVTKLVGHADYVQIASLKGHLRALSYSADVIIPSLINDLLSFVRMQ